MVRLLDWVVLAILVGGWIIAGASSSTASEDPLPETDRDSQRITPEKESEIRRLVAQLGHLEYGVREAAVQKLVTIGYPAVDIVSENTQNPDREVRVRARRVLTLIREVDFERRLAAFVVERDDRNSHGLPGWETVRELLARQTDDANELALRELFVEMQKAEPDLMRALENPKANVRELVAQRIQQLRQAPEQTGEGCSIGSFAAVMLVSARQPQVNASLGLFQLCRHDTVRASIQAGNKKALLRKIIGNWVVQCSDSVLIPQALVLTYEYQISEGLGMAEKVLSEHRVSGKGTSQFDLLQNAVFVIGKMGSERHIPLLESLLTDTSTRLNLQARASGPEFQIRDLALLTILKRTGQNPAEYGYRETVLEDQVTGAQNVWYLDSNTRRQAAVDLWKSRKEAKSKSTSEK